MKLTAKQKKFVTEYLVDLNATQAAIRSGYSKKCAAETGYENLRKPHIAAAIQQARKDLAIKQNIATPEELMEGYTREIRFDPRKLYDKHGKLKPVTDLDDDTALALTGIEITEKSLLDGKNQTIIERNYKYRLPDKRQNRDSMKKVYGMDKPEQHEHSIKEESMASVVRAVRDYNSNKK